MPCRERIFVALLKDCAKLKDVSFARDIHAKLSIEGLLEKNTFLGSSLVDAYAKCGALKEAHEVFDLLPTRDVVAWTALIGGYAHHEQNQAAMYCYKQMQLEGVASNAWTYACLLKACGNAAALYLGEAIHIEITKTGLSENNVYLGNALINMYANCGSLEKARSVFEQLPMCDVACWNAMILGFAHNEQGDEAIACYSQMQMAGFPPDAFTFACSLQACCSIRALHQGMELHTEIARKGLLKDNFVLSNALMDMYGKCGDLQKLDEMFHQIVHPNVVSWTAMIANYAEHDQNEEALACFEQMRAAGISPNATTFGCCLRACGNMVFLEKGEELHIELIHLKLLKNDSVLVNALIDMYCKCGLPLIAQSISKELLTTNASLGTTLITGFALTGDTMNALRVLNKMVDEGAKPCIVTFVSVLSSCSHEGLTDEGQHIFMAMSNVFGLVPCIEHCTSIVDLFSRAGRLDISLELAFKIPSHPSRSMWLSVWGGCRKWGDTELGRQVFHPAVELGIKEL